MACWLSVLPPDTKFVSLRCDAYDSQNEITFDKYGRPTGANSSCKDTNPGTFHVLMANYFGKQGEAFTAEQTQAMVREILSDAQWERLEREKQLDFCHYIPTAGRYRATLQGSIETASDRLAATPDDD